MDVMPSSREGSRASETFHPVGLLELAAAQSQLDLMQ